MLNAMVAYPAYRRETRKKMKNGKRGLKAVLVKKACPFIQKPYDDNLCANMLNQNMEVAIYYCGGNFRKCATYKRWS